MTPKRVLIVRVGAMGDIVHALPAVAALRRERPDWLIDWAAEGRWSDLLVSPLEDEGPVVDQMVPVRVGFWKAHGFSAATVKDVLGLRRWLRAARFDLCVDLQGSVRSAVIGWMAGTRLVGAETPREGPARWLYGRQVATASVHVVDQACEILGAAVGLKLDAGDGPLPFPEDDATEQWCEAFLADVPVDRGYVVLAPTAGWGAKEWPAERFGELAGRLANAGWTVLVNLTNPKSKPEAVEGSEGRALVLDCSIAQLAGILRRSALFVGGDTGPLHLADALGVPCVGLFGPTDPARNGPYFGMKSGRARVLRDASSVTSHARVRETEAGLGRIGVDEVFRAARELLRSAH